MRRHVSSAWCGRRGHSGREYKAHPTSYQHGLLGHDGGVKRGVTRFTCPRRLKATPTPFPDLSTHFVVLHCLGCGTPVKGWSTVFLLSLRSAAHNLVLGTGDGGTEWDTRGDLVLDRQGPWWSPDHLCSRLAGIFMPTL